MNYFEQIDSSRLSRNFAEKPLLIGEFPTKEDMEYLVIELLLPFSIISKYLGTSVDKCRRIAGEFKIKRTKEQILEVSRKTCIERYGVDSPRKCDFVKDKYKKTCLERYGTDNAGRLPQFIEKKKQTNLEKFGKESYSQTEECKEKVRQTSFEKYGVSNYTKSNEYWIKREESTLLKYGVQHTSQTEEYKKKKLETTQQKYGVDYYAKTDECKERLKNTNLEKYGVESYLSTEEFKEKRKQTCLEKYGVESYSQTEHYRERWINTQIERYGDLYSRTEECKERQNVTKRNNNTFNTSKPENICYELLKEKFKMVLKQYSDERYPFKCDFYIPPLDLFIEYKGAPDHGGCLFNADDKTHIQKLNKWKKLSEDFHKKNPNKRSRYDSFIYTWTDLDVRKMKFVYKNNLNYLEFYTQEQFNEWIHSI